MICMNVWMFQWRSQSASHRMLHCRENKCRLFHSKRDPIKWNRIEIVTAVFNEMLHNWAYVFSSKLFFNSLRLSERTDLDKEMRKTNEITSIYLKFLWIVNNNNTSDQSSLVVQFFCFCLIQWQPLSTVQEKIGFLMPTRYFLERFFDANLFRIN